MPGFSRRATCHAPAEEVWKLLYDPARYTEWWEGTERVELAVRGALACGALDGRAVAVLARRAERPDVGRIDDLAPRLAALGGEEPSLAAYDALLERGGGR